MMELWSACSVGHSCVCAPKKSTPTAGSTTPVRTASPSTQTTLAAGTTRRARPCTASDTGSRRACSVKLALCNGSGQRPTVHRTTQGRTAATRSCWGPSNGTLTSAVGPARTAIARCLTLRCPGHQGHRTPVPARGSKSSATALTFGCSHQVARHPRRSQLYQRPRRPQPRQRPRRPQPRQRPRQPQPRQRPCRPRRHPRHHPCRCLSLSQSLSLHQCRRAVVALLPRQRPPWRLSLHPLQRLGL